MGRRFVALSVLACLVQLGCRQSIKDDCRSYCDWIDDCGDSEVRDCVDDCIEDVKSADDECQDSFGDLADCVEDHDDCEEVDCGLESITFINDCIDDFD